MKIERYKTKQGGVPPQSVESRKKVDETLSSSEIIASLKQFTEKLEIQQNKLLEYAANLAQKVENSSLSGGKKQKLLEKIKRISIKSLKVVAGSTVLFFAFITADHQATRYKVDAIEDPIDHSTRYRHQDPETTHIINMLAGMEKLTLDEEVRLIKESFSRASDLEYLKEIGIWSGTKEELKDADSHTIAELIRNLDANEKVEVSDIEKSDEEVIDSEFAINSDVDDEKVYTALWEMMRECGNPKIRIIHTDSDYFRHNADYDFLTNTVRLSPKQNYDLTRLLIAELSHGKQFGGHPYKTWLQGIKDFARTGRTILSEKTSIQSAYEDTYDIPGSVEYGAHHIIEPKLQEEFVEKTASGPIALERAKLEQKRVDEIKQAKEKAKAEEHELLEKQHREMAELSDKLNNKSKGIHGPQRVKIWDWYDAQVDLLKKKHDDEYEAFKKTHKNYF